MITEDHRNISCGGDPFNYLKSVMKGINIQLDPGQDAEVILQKEKFPYDRPTFEGLARTTKLTITDLKETGDDVHIFLRKPQE